MSASPIGVLGGSFDPVHYGHLAIARLACDFFELDTFYFIPASLPPHKSDSVEASGNDRLAMLRTAVHDNPCFRIWDGEFKRTGPSYTIDTLGELRQQHPGSTLYFVIGADNLSEIRTWRRYRDILKTVILCVTARPGYELSIPDEIKMAELKKFPSPQMAVSSSLIRNYLQAGYSCAYMLPKAVLNYIDTHALYRSE
ncbi:MAG: nicotinate (nicotinamide) nucleotide adenylyltransferase [Chitinivibrionales bacterium]|nr:nicotinate (nicotinamide) nucleotide adenylyltransferase [Chitinivibrionales bacterium]